MPATLAAVGKICLVRLLQVPTRDDGKGCRRSRPLQ